MQFRIKFITPVVFSLLFIMGIATISFDTIPCRASAKDSEPPVFSLDVKDQPLGKVLEKVSKTTGYKITVNKEGLDIPVTTSFQDVNVYEGLRRILGSLNHSIISNEKEKRISVVVITNGIQKKIKEAISHQKTIDPKDETVTPPGQSGRGLTLAEYEAIKQQQTQKTITKNTIVTPPGKSGRGLTLGELEAIKEKQSQTINKDTVVTPPGQSGHGLTLAEYEAIKQQQTQKTITRDTIVTPPGKSGRGLTLGELEAIKKAKQ